MINPINPAKCKHNIVEFDGIQSSFDLRLKRKFGIIIEIPKYAQVTCVSCYDTFYLDNSYVPTHQGSFYFIRKDET